MNDLKYIHFWKVGISDIGLQNFIDLAIQNKSYKIFYILLEEKLRRVETEISIT